MDVSVGGLLKHVAELARPQAEERAMEKLALVISNQKRWVVVVGPIRSLYRGTDEVSVRIWKRVGEL